MYRTKSGWYYVGHGQLRYMDADGWTEQYRNIDNPPPVASPYVPAPSSALAPQQDQPGPPGPRKKSPPLSTWLAFAAVVAVTAVVVSASGADLARPAVTADIPSSTPRAQGHTAQPVRVPARVPVRSPAQATPLVRPTPSISPLVGPTPSISPLVVGGDFSREFALAKAADVTGDMRIVDECIADRIDVNSALVLLSRSYGRLAEAGVPPSLDRSDYLGRVVALQSLAAQAAEGYDVDRAGTLAKYATVRDGTGVLFEQLNDALGSHLSLP